ncbi:hypothetical protein MRX96_059222 [Rhipicephalus microplus]
MPLVANSSTAELAANGAVPDEELQVSLPVMPGKGTTALRRRRLYAADDAAARLPGDRASSPERLAANRQVARDKPAGSG